MTPKHRPWGTRAIFVFTALQVLTIAPLWAQKAPLALSPPKLLTYAAPVYPPESQRVGRRGTVVLELDVAIDGSVSKVTVLKSTAVEFNAAAAAAGRRLRFSPARRDGVAITVRIRFQYRFEPDAGLERRGRARGLGSYNRRGWERAPSGFESLRGRVIERGTGRAVVAATVLIASLKRETLTDIEGRFAFGLLKSGTWKVLINGAEHRPVTKTVQIREGKTTTRSFRTNRRSYVMYKATAVAPPQPGEMARRSLTAGEIQRIPGVYGDAFKVVQNLPGVARAPAISGQIIVRGSAPGDTQINIEGVRVPILYHFGGLYSVVNTDILEGIDFFPGGYSVRYGRKTGGLLQARLKLAKDNAKWRGYVETNVFHTGLFLSGPLSEDIQLSIAARRSYIDVILNNALPEGTLPFTVAPRYWDYQLKLDWRISAKMDATALVLGSDDSLAAIIDRPPPGFGQANAAALFNTNFHGGLILLRMRGEGWKARTTLGLIRAGANVDLLGDFRFDVTNWQTTFRQDFQFGEGPVQLRTGLDMFVDPFRASILLPPQAADLGEGTEAQAGSRLLNQRATAVQPALWFDTVFRLRPDLEVVPGVRLDLFRGQNSGQTWLPRINVRWRVNPSWTLKAASGVLSQPPAVSDVVDRFGNPKLQPFYSWESALGVEGKVWDRLTVDIQVFHKQLWDM
ncbi:MAG TPA: hypothetical protein DCQ06_00960, partial [Myxococcales bacterium]|nr:hypothetical protein [Myxococcales bacterium]